MQHNAGNIKLILRYLAEITALLALAAAIFYFWSDTGCTALGQSRFAGLFCSPPAETKLLAEVQHGFASGKNRLKIILKDKAATAESGKLAFYAENFREDPGVLSPMKQDENILWLGSRATLALDHRTLTKFSLVLASTPLLKNSLQAFGIKAFYFPMFTDMPELQHITPQYFAVIGNPPHIEDILQQKRIFYRKYSLSGADKIKADMKKFKAVFVEKTAFSDNSLDIHPLILQIAAAEIPLAAFWSWPNDDTINLFNDRVNFYMYREDAARLIDDMRANSPVLAKRAAKARNLVAREYSAERAAQRLAFLRQAAAQAKRQGKTAADIVEPQMPAAKRSITIDVPIAVGHYGAGDYWLAQDLAEYLEGNGAETDLTFFNSLYKYKSENNILVRGFIPPAAGDLTGEDNILYLAYAQFPQNGQEEFVPERETYLNQLAEAAKGVDAVAIASESLAAALYARGINASYIPQFTNTRRFFPEFDATAASDVLFVGINAFYRHAAHILLKHGLPVTIYGPGWPDGIAKGHYLDNRILHKYYSSAKIVLNDTRDGMKQFGFISNRIFDATACGALVISDYMPEIAAVYGDTVPMYRNEDELVALVKYYLDPAHDGERREKAARAREITLMNFTAEKAAKRFEEIIRNVKQNKKTDCPTPQKGRGISSTSARVPDGHNGHRF